MNQPSETSNDRLDHVPVRLSYVAPQLVCLGDVRDLTLGGSPGTGDSGSAGTQQF